MQHAALDKVLLSVKNDQEKELQEEDLIRAQESLSLPPNPPASAPTPVPVPVAPSVKPTAAAVPKASREDILARFNAKPVVTPSKKQAEESKPEEAKPEIVKQAEVVKPEEIMPANTATAEPEPAVVEPASDTSKKDIVDIPLDESDDELGLEEAAV
jgi:hypothetical protein